MSVNISAEAPRLQAEQCWPISGPHWSNMSHEHHVKADGRKWSHLTPNGSTLDAPSKQSIIAKHKVAMERRAILRQAVSRGLTGKSIRLAGKTVGKFEKAAGYLEELAWDDLALSVSGLIDQARERRQQIVTPRVAELNTVLDSETATLGIFMDGPEFDNRLMARLGGFFARSENDGDIQQPGITILGRNDEAGQPPQGYRVIGLYLRA